MQFMSDGPATSSRVSGATWIGLFLSLFGVVIIRQAFRLFGPTCPSPPWLGDNMIGHFLVDFVGNVLPRLFS
jgi:hypothetical protein